MFDFGQQDFQGVKCREMVLGPLVDSVLFYAAWRVLASGVTEESASCFTGTTEKALDGQEQGVRFLRKIKQLGAKPPSSLPWQENREDLAKELSTRTSAWPSFCSLSRGQISVCCSLC